MLQTFTLKNGLKVVTYSIPEMRSVYLSQVVKAGSIFDTLKTNGAAHFMEHLLVQGTPSFPTVENLSDFMESLAGGYNASTTRDTVKFTSSFPSIHVNEVLKLAAEVFFEPLFNDQEIEKERNAVVEEIKTRQTQTNYKNWRFYTNTRYKKNSPMQLDVGGSLEAVKNIRKNDLTSYWQEFFSPQNTYLILVGGFENKLIQKQVENIYQKYDKGILFKGYPKITNQDMSKRSVVIREDQEYKTCFLDLSLPSISLKDPIKERITQSIIRAILGGLRSSRLYRLLRQRLGLVYNVGFDSFLFIELGEVGVYCQVAYEKLEEVTKLITQELVTFIQNGPSLIEIENAKSYAINRNLMVFDQPNNIASWIEDDLLWEDKIYLPDEYVKLIEKVDYKEIMDFIKKYWDFSKLNLSIQGPLKNSKINISKFEKIIQELK